MKIELAPGDRLEITLKDTDGEFIVDFDSKGDSKLTIETDFPDTSGRKGIIYEEDFSQTPGKEVLFDSLHLANE